MEAPDNSTLERLYVQELKSLAEIGRLYGVHRNQVRRWLLRAAIPTRSAVEGQKLVDLTGPKSEAHAAALRKNAVKARAAVTPEGNRRGAAKRRGRPAPNKGKRASEETRAKLRAQRADPEYRRKQSENLKGEKSHFWRGGQTPEETLRMRGWVWRARAAECYARDGWTCQDCGVHCTKKGKTRIQAHHLVARRDGGSDDLLNLITLCVTCHTRRERTQTG